MISDLSSAREPLGVEFISGSQRFRVAVALALAIGKYSGSGARDIRSVIVDEGFGSLDSDGRRSMISLVKGLASILDCVILVSHQEEFQNAFPNGYHIVKGENGCSAVHRRRDGGLVEVAWIADSRSHATGFQHPHPSRNTTHKPAPTGEERPEKHELEQSTRTAGRLYSGRRYQRFDLNIEKVLEYWTVAHTVRELIANALDEQSMNRP